MRFAPAARFAPLFAAACGPFLVPLTAGAADPAPESATHYADVVRPQLVEYCGDCHAPDDEDNHVNFLAATTDGAINDARGLWGSVAEQLRNRTMPPADSAFQPTEDERRELADWIDGFLRATACERGPYAGPVVARRLNRQEYDNTLRDLLYVDLRPAEDFPADGAGGEGFDNNGETLFSSPILLERYLAATAEVLDAAISTPRLNHTIPPSKLRPVPEENADAPRTLKPGETLSAPLTVYVAADVTVAVKFERDAAGPVTLNVDGVPVGALSVDDAGGVPPRAKATLRLERGDHVLELTNPGKSPLRINGIGVWDDRPDAPRDDALVAHERLLGVPPYQRPDAPRAGARDALARLARRAFRRPVEPAEVEALMTLYDRSARRGDPWEESVKLAARGVLLSPKFLFRTEPPQESGSPADGSEEGEPQLVDDHALASRLSYFLWASMPDEALFELADAGRLSDPAVLDAQVDRMLADPKANGLAKHFAGQWLGTREVGGRIAPDVNRFRAIFSDELLDDLNAQPAEWFLYLLREDRPLREVIDADYAVVNERLSYHYGLAEPPEKLRGDAGKTADRGKKWMHEKKVDSAFRRFDLKGEDRARRGGVLGLGGALLASSYSQRTSPVLRGAWVLETLLGIKVPSPPPDVPELKGGNNSKGTVREKLARHRADPACSACHNLMDPVGFALDNYDILGRWRTEEGGAPIDASATLPDGEAFEGPEGLRRVLLKQEDRVVRHLAAKLLGYALGRSLEDGDDCTIDRVVAEATENGATTRALVKAVVRSVPFRMIARDPAPPHDAAHENAPDEQSGAKR
ncbi:DUF1592 domain-containing protein [Alienimonas californiensis]|uniref:Planctomycete cytochrome C n=1 Tax=Alienimonas californiensis TaxID=2527989 RepID=A0A517PFJ2_9PLAN|nr:DUF1592 domain-containing protein [Alienimonas californiensis]QDT18146.1 hypothetical protein CA12_42860 [Alienimonas californiensis]